MHHIATKEEAFAKLEGEISIPIDRSMHDFHFRRRWFQLRNQATASTFIKSHYDPNRSWNFLHIGIFEGMCEVWTMQNVLCSPASHLVCIDPWESTAKLDSAFMESCCQNAIHNLSPWKDQITFICGYSQDILKEAIKYGGLADIDVGKFDFAMIDGDHGAEPAYIDMVNCLQMVKQGGWLVCDDVRTQVPKENNVRAGLEHFLADYGDQVKMVWEHRYCSCLEKL